MANLATTVSDLTGYLQHLQVEDDPANGPYLLCRLMVEKENPPPEYHHFFLRLAQDNRLVAEAQFDLLRNAIVHQMRVRIRYDPTPSNFGTASRIVAVRLQLPEV